MELTNTQKCEFCGKEFKWRCTKPNQGEVIVSRIENLAKNVKEFNETNTQYIIGLQCPNCLKVQYVEINK